MTSYRYDYIYLLLYLDNLPYLIFIYLCYSYCYLYLKIIYADILNVLFIVILPFYLIIFQYVGKRHAQYRCSAYIIPAL